MQIPISFLNDLIKLLSNRSITLNDSDNDSLNFKLNSHDCRTIVCDWANTCGDIRAVFGKKEYKFLSHLDGRIVKNIGDNICDSAINF